MSVYLVTWDLNKEGTAYDKARELLLKGIHMYKDVKHHSSLDSVRFISTQSTADQIYKYLKDNKYIDSDDMIVVSKMEKGADTNEGNLGQDLWTWINARV